MMKGREVKLKQNDMTNIDMRQHAIKATMNQEGHRSPKKGARKAGSLAGGKYVESLARGRKEGSKYRRKKV